MFHLEPYLLFRLFVFIFLGSYFIYTCLEIVFWYKNLPRLPKKYILRSLFILKFSTFKKELLLIGLLMPFIIYVFYLNIKVSQ
jgi:hypothetical protein